MLTPLQYKLVAVFDSKDTANLTGSKLTFSENGTLINELKAAGFFNIFNHKIKQAIEQHADLFGIYVVSVKADIPHFLDSKGPNILYEIPKSIIKDAQNKKIVIVIDNQSEGRDLKYSNFDGFLEMHLTMRNLKLPPFSVLLINGDMMVPEQYEQWLQEHNADPMFNHICLLAWTYIFRKSPIPEYPLILDALKNDSKDYNSLNRTTRDHRLAHLYTLIKHNILKNGLVSGNWTNNLNQPKDTLLHRSRVINVTREELTHTLWENLPVEADGLWLEADPDSSDKHIFNYDIYKNSLVSVVTETHFIEKDTFFTEKIFKPIAAGHPFILLGSWRMLEALRKLGYRTDFDMFDDSYDSIISNSSRFAEVHEHLIKWVSLSRDEKEKSIQRSMDVIIHNQELFRKTDYIKNGYKSLYSAIEYTQQTRNNENNKPFKQQF
jgi:hypothetical protein